MTCGNIDSILGSYYIHRRANNVKPNIYQMWRIYSVYCICLKSFFTDSKNCIWILQLQPSPRLSFRLPLLFLTDNPILWSKCLDSFVWKHKKSIKFGELFFFSFTCQIIARRKMAPQNYLVKPHERFQFGNNPMWIASCKKIQFTTLSTVKHRSNVCLKHA